MKTGTITAVQQNGTWSNDRGTFYSMEVTLDDGTSGEVNAKSEDRWKVGDKVNVLHETETQYGKKWRLDKADFAGNAPTGNRPGNGGDRSKEITASWAIGQALHCDPGLLNNTEALVEASVKLLGVHGIIVKQQEA